MTEVQHADLCPSRMGSPCTCRALIAKFHCDINPIAWKAPTAFAKRFGGKVTASVAPNVEVATFQVALRELLAEQWGDREPYTGPVELVWRFNRKLISYVSDTGRTVTKHRVDGTNLQKAAEDCLQAHKKSDWQGVIANDVQVVRWRGEIVRQEKDVEDPYVEVEVWAI